MCISSELRVQNVCPVSRGQELGLLSLVKRRLREISSMPVSTWREYTEDAARFFSVVLCVKTRGCGQKLQPRRFPLNTRSSAALVDAGALAQAAQKLLSLLPGALQKLPGHGRVWSRLVQSFLASLSYPVSPRLTWGIAGCLIHTCSGKLIRKKTNFHHLRWYSIVILTYTSTWAVLKHFVEDLICSRGCFVGQILQ